MCPAHLVRDARRELLQGHAVIPKQRKRFLLDVTVNPKLVEQIWNAALQGRGP